MFNKSCGVFIVLYAFIVAVLLAIKYVFDYFEYENTMITQVGMVIFGVSTIALLFRLFVINKNKINSNRANIPPPAPAPAPAPAST